MGFRYQRRVNLGSGAGLNISKSGVSPSVRTRFGSVRGKGFSIRTGLPGLTYRSSSRRESSGAGLIVLVLVALVGILPFLIRLIVGACRLIRDYYRPRSSI